MDVSPKESCTFAPNSFQKLDHKGICSLDAGHHADPMSRIEKHRKEMNIERHNDSSSALTPEHRRMAQEIEALIRAEFDSLKSDEQPPEKIGK